MSPLDTPTALVAITTSAIAFVVWAVWVTRDALQARRASRRASGTRSRVTPPKCHVTGCPFPAWAGRYCHGHSAEGRLRNWPAA